MGKASRWLMNFLLGRQESESKEGVVSVSASEEYWRIPYVAGMPKIKRQWSFGRSFCKDIIKPHSKSLHLIDSAVKLPVLEVETRRRHSVDIVTDETWGTSKGIQNAAATKIQAAFRSHLARKALHALRGLVKLQALVRGHLVRKQATATLRRMHALMAIQVRARFQRVQMADQESNLIAQSHSSRHRNITHENGSRRHTSRETMDMNLHERHGVLKSKKGYQNHTQFERTEQGFTAYYSGDISISKREHQYQKFSFIRTHNNSNNNSPLLLSPMSMRLTPGRASFSDLQQDCSILPNYMSNTESFRAKSRSQSEPKQRPQQNTKTKAKQMPSIDGDSNQQPSLSCGSQEPWFPGMHTKQERSKDGEYDCGRKINHLNLREFLIACEPHATMF